MNIATLTITQNDIDTAEKANPNSCPIALALRRATGKDWSVSNTIARCNYAIVWLPRDMQFFIHDFDQNKDNVCPQTFTLEVPEGITL